MSVLDLSEILSSLQSGTANPEQQAIAAQAIVAMHAQLTDWEQRRLSAVAKFEELDREYRERFGSSLSS